MSDPSHTPAQASTVEDAFYDFIDAFDRLEWARFAAYVAADATVFMPGRLAVERLGDRPVITTTFQDFFTTARTRLTGPNYLKLNPSDVHIQAYGDVALITFHLKEESETCRRTMLFQWRKERWMLCHLHASNIAKN